MNSSPESNQLKPDQPYIQHLDAIAASDVETIRTKDREYQGSWLKRGGVGAAMNLFRKADRVEAQLAQCGYDVFKALEEDKRPEGLIDDLRDLRRYLLLVEAAAIQQGVIAQKESFLTIHLGSPSQDERHTCQAGEGSDIAKIVSCGPHPR